MTGLIELVALVAIIYYAVHLFKIRKNKVKAINYQERKKYRIGLLISIIVLFISAGINGSQTETVSDNSSSSDKGVKVEKRTKYVGKDKYSIVKKENVALVAKKKKLVDQEADLRKQQDQIVSDEQQVKEQAQKQQKEAQEQQEQQAQEQQDSAQASSQVKGDMNTGNSGTVVGNSKSHIYHVPGQRGYNMNSSNAVYFDNEQDAINAGYRRSKV